MIYRRLLILFWFLKNYLKEVFLAAIVLSIGLTTVVSGLGVVVGYQAEIERLTFGFYNTSIVLTENKSLIDEYGSPRNEDVEKIKSEVEGVLATYKLRTMIGEIKYADKVTISQIYGLDSTNILNKMNLLNTPTHTIELQNNDCLIGYKLSRRLGFTKRKKTKNDQVLVNGVLCNVIGTLSESDSRVAEAYSNSIILNIRFFIQYVYDKEDLAPNELDEAIFVFSDVGQLPDKIIEIDRLLRSEFGVSQSRESPFKYQNENYPLSELLAQRKLVSSILVLVGAFSIVSSMVGFAALWRNITVSRENEIATKLALGETSAGLFFMSIGEVVAVSLVGISIGVCTSFILYFVVQNYIDIPFQINHVALFSSALSTVIAAICLALRVNFKISRTPLSRIVK